MMSKRPTVEEGEAEHNVFLEETMDEIHFERAKRGFYSGHRSGTALDSEPNKGLHTPTSIQTVG